MGGCGGGGGGILDGNPISRGETRYASLNIMGGCEGMTLGNQWRASLDTLVVAANADDLVKSC